MLQLMSSIDEFHFFIINLNMHHNSIYFDFTIKEKYFSLILHKCTRTSSGTKKESLSMCVFFLCFAFSFLFFSLEINFIRTTKYCICNKNIGSHCFRRWFPFAISTFLSVPSSLLCRYLQYSHPWEVYGMRTSLKMSLRPRRLLLLLLLIPNVSLGSHFIFCIWRKKKHKKSNAPARTNEKKNDNNNEENGIVFISSSLLSHRLAHLVVSADDDGSRKTQAHPKKTYIQTKWHIEYFLLNEKWKSGLVAIEACHVCHADEGITHGPRIVMTPCACEFCICITVCL